MMADTQKTIKVTLVRSMIGTQKFHRDSVRGLGLRRMHQSVEVADTPENRGMIRRAAFLLKTEA